MDKKSVVSGATALAVLFGNLVMPGLPGQGGLSGLPLARAAAPGAVVISEVAWAGSADSSNDEFIELYNTTGAVVDLSGWTLFDDGVSSVLNGTIAAHSYFLIEDSEVVVNPNVADLILNLSLANTGDSLSLIDESANVIDTVNSSGGMWFSGNSTTKATMERIDLLAGGDSAANWASSTGSGSSATSSLGSLIIGTPGLQNSVCSGMACAAPSGAAVSMSVPVGDVFLGDSLTVTVAAENVSDLFSYGTTVTYDPAVLEFSSASVGAFLSAGGVVSTSFQYGLENDLVGRLLIAEARTIDPKVGVSGSGSLYSMTFNVIGGEGLTTMIGFDGDSFVADIAGEFGADFNGMSLDIAVATTDPASGLVAGQGTERYSIVLNWTASPNATSYRVSRQDAHGQYVLLGETAGVTFTDSDAVLTGGNIIPNLNYSYRVIAVRSGVESSAIDVIGVETRGLKGDNNRSDRVDGRDLDSLARNFALTDVSPDFDALTDTTYDAMVDGSDLIDLGANFALTY